MSIVVHKYGGSSVSDLDKIKRVAQRIIAEVEAGKQVVAVVSAMGNTTNELIALARRAVKAPPRRELDMLISVGERITTALLAMVLQDHGVPARSLTGSQSGIITDESHAHARVVEVRPDRVRKHLDLGEVVVIAGFQGVSTAREVTTLGRGGTDTSAVVLAAALGAEYCEICSDVDGVWSADPRVVPEAVKLDEMSLDEALALARGGAKVLFEDAVRYARDQGVTIRAAETFGPGTGTRLVPQVVPRTGATAVTGDTQLVRIALDELSAAVAGGGTVRRVVGSEGWVDIRNAHGGVTGEETAVVTAVGSGLGEQVDTLLRVRALLADNDIPVRTQGGAGDTLWWEVEPGHCDAATRHVHRALV